MKEHHRSSRTLSRQKGNEKDRNFARELVSIVVLTLIWIGVAGYSLHLYQTLQSQTAQTRRECSEKINAIKKLNDDIASLDMDIEKLQSEPRIRLKIRQMGLSLRPTEPQQISHLVIRKPSAEYAASAARTVLVDRER